MVVLFNVKNKYLGLLSAFFTIPKKQAKEYWNNPDLLIPEIKLGITSKEQIIPFSALFHGPENAKYSAIIAVTGKATERDGNFLAFDNDTVVDTKINLMWEKSGSNYKMNWHQTENYANKLNQKKFADYSDWRIPTIEELRTLIRSKKVNGYYISPVFKMMSELYWSSSSRPYTIAGAWGVNFYGGSYDYGGHKSLDSCYVRAVRSGQ
ncbi:putative DUF1566 domain-containing protein [Candidatus Magnetomoraceae bacterium gMMP-15]